MVLTMDFNSSRKADAWYVPDSIMRSFFSHIPVSSALFSSSSWMVAIRSFPVCVG